jgi:hypothetical protein
MAGKRNGNNNRLEEAMAVLINNQAQFLSQMLEVTREFTEIKERLTRIEAILLRHEVMLEELPEAVREKIGFKTK